MDKGDAYAPSGEIQIAGSNDPGQPNAAGDIGKTGKENILTPRRFPLTSIGSKYNPPIPRETATTEDRIGEQRVEEPGDFCNIPGVPDFLNNVSRPGNISEVPCLGKAPESAFLANPTSYIPTEPDAPASSGVGVDLLT